jgi:hypothetical protein
MRFTIEFPGNPQVFDVYIFSFDKNKMAGTTVWGGRTFGVLALKTASRLVVAGLASPVHRTGAAVGAEYVGPRRRGTGSSAEPSGSPTRVLLPDGTIEMRYPDGTVKSKKFGNCGWNTRYPDGHTVPSMCAYSQTIPVVPPPPPSGSKEEKWLLAQDDNLLAILQTVLGGASSADYQNYLQNYENPPESVLYKQIYYRTRAIEELTSTPQ